MFLFLGVLLTLMLSVRFSINFNYLLLSLTMFSKHMKFIDFHWFLQGLWNSVDYYCVLMFCVCFLSLSLTFRMFGQTLTLSKSFIDFCWTLVNLIGCSWLSKIFGVCRFYCTSFFCQFLSKLGKLHRLSEDFCGFFVDFSLNHSLECTQPTHVTIFLAWMHPGHGSLSTSYPVQIGTLVAQTCTL